MRRCCTMSQYSVAHPLLLSLALIVPSVFIIVVPVHYFSGFSEK